MKILLINEVYGVLSTGRTVKELQNHLKEQGHSCVVAYAYKKQTAMKMDQERQELMDYYVIGSAIDRKLHALCSRIFGLQGYFSTGATKKLIRYISDQKPDVVQLGNVHGNYLNLNLLLKYLARQDIAVTIVLHDCWFYTGRCTHYTANECYQWHEGCMRCPNNRNTPTSWFFDRSKKMWKDKKKYFKEIKRLAVIGVSEWITNEARDSFLKDAFLIKRIYNGINLEIFKPMDTSQLRKELGLEDKFIIISVAAIWGDAKGLKGFVQLANHLHKQHEKSRLKGKQEKECVILLVGSMNTEIDIPSNVRIIPATDSTTVLAELYNVGDVYVSLSREESFGKTVAEALACGTPAIAFQSTALPELIGEGCGHLVTNHSLNGVYECLREVRDKGKVYYSDHCISYAREHFSKEHFAQEYCSTYEELLS
jgi:glycosyltransferase involved in cell wall biosynthesis